MAYIAEVLPLMYIYELTDILFAIKCFKKHTKRFDSYSYPSIYNLMNQQLDLSTPSFVTIKIYNNTITANSYFCRLPRLWNALPIIDLTLSIPIIKYNYKLKHFLRNHFVENFDVNNHYMYFSLFLSL